MISTGTMSFQGVNRTPLRTAVSGNPADDTPAQPQDGIDLSSIPMDQLVELLPADMLMELMGPEAVQAAVQPKGDPMAELMKSMSGDGGMDLGALLAGGPGGGVPGLTPEMMKGMGMPEMSDEQMKGAMAAAEKMAQDPEIVDMMNEVMSNADGDMMGAMMKILSDPKKAEKMMGAMGPMDGLFGSPGAPESEPKTD